MKFEWRQGEHEGLPEKFWSCLPALRSRLSIEAFHCGLEVSIWVRADYPDPREGRGADSKWLLVHDEIITHEPACKFREAEAIYCEFVRSISQKAEVLS